MNSNEKQHLTVLNKVASMTDERDLEMLEKSMLLTAYDLLNPDVVMLYRKPEKSSPVFSMLWDGDKIVQRHSTDDRYDFDELRIKNSVTVFPLQGTKSLLGYFLVERDREASAEEYMMIAGLLKIYNNFLTILDDSRRDGLTGLLNRRMFDQQFKRILMDMIDDNNGMPSSNRKRVAVNDTIWLAILDIDNFKNVNDTFGHLYGDEVLILLARFLNESFREHDLVFRFGGEEFAVLLQTPTKVIAVETLERLCRGIENHVFPQVGKVTASIGVVQVSDQLIPPLMVGNADEALYYAKGKGKNQVVFYEDMPEEAHQNFHNINGDVELFYSSK